MIKQIVLDTCAVISYFDEQFGAGSTISRKGLDIVEEALESLHTPYRLLIPSIVFVEIMDKWFINEERQSQLYFNVFTRLVNCDNVAIRPLSCETLYILSTLHGSLHRHDLHDKLIVSVALEMDAFLMTSDGPVKTYFSLIGRTNRVIS